MAINYLYALNFQSEGLMSYHISVLEIVINMTRFHLLLSTPKQFKGLSNDSDNWGQKIDSLD